MNLLQAILCALVVVYGQIDFALGTLYLNRPIFMSAITGLILNDLQQGVIIGATLELFFMGYVSVGAYVPPDVKLGSVVAAALTIINGYDTEIAVTLAMPIALLSQALSSLITILQPFFLQKADKYAAESNPKGVIKMQWSIALIGCVKQFVLGFIACYYGATFVEGFINAVPDWVTSGMSVAGGLMPAMGFAMLMRMILTKQIVHYYFLGFVLAAYLQMPTLGVAILAVIYVIAKYNLFETDSESDMKLAHENNTGGIDDEF